MRRITLALACAALVSVCIAGSVLAAPKSGCPAGEGWGEWTVEAAADRIWPALVDPDAFPGGIADLEAALSGYDANADGSVCVKIMWGEDLNPNSHWYLFGIELLGSPIEQFLPRDNNAGA
jgi:hypothetical protein